MSPPIPHRRSVRRTPPSNTNSSTSMSTGSSSWKGSMGRISITASLLLPLHSSVAAFQLPPCRQPPPLPSSISSSKHSFQPRTASRTPHQFQQLNPASTLSTTTIDIGIHSRHVRQAGYTRLCLGFLEEDNRSTNTFADPNSNSNTNATPSSSTSSSSQHSSILQPSSKPSILINDNDRDQEIYASAVVRTLSWVAAAILFGTGLYLSFGQETAEEFFAGYLVEQSLSVDNLFVFLLLFDYFQVPLQNQDRVLNYGIYGAIVMRAVMIGLGTVALSQFHGILLVFAGILIYSSATVILNLLNEASEEEEEEDMSENSIVKFSRNLIDSTEEFDGNRFFTMENGMKKATPLLICLVAVEISDVVFAVDSIPAVFGVTENPLIVFSSNMFAIMGLRSLYTILSKAAKDLEYLEPAVAVVLGFIGSKMVAEYFGIMVPTELSLGVVLTFLSGGVGLSVVTKQQKEERELEQQRANGPER